MYVKYVALLAVAAWPAVASAGTVPSLSGSYVYQGEEICPAALTASKNGTGAITNIGAANPGTASVDILTPKFTPGAGTPNSGTLQGSGFHNETNNVVTPPGASYSPSDKPTSISTTYSNTATAVKLGDGETLHIIYGKVISGVVQWAAFSSERIDKLGSSVGVSCMTHGTLTRI